MVSLESAWKVFLESKTMNPNSERKEVYRYNLHLRDYWKDTDISTIKYKDIDLFKNHLFAKLLAPKTVKNCLGLLKAILNKAIKYELYVGTIPEFPTIKFDNKRNRFLSKKEAKLLLSILKEKSKLWHDITLLALHTGMRAGEIFKLKAESINFEQQTLVLHETKNSYSRTILLNKTLLHILEEYAKKGMKFLFFENPPRDVSDHFRTAVKLAKLNDGVTDRRNRVVFHSLRHTFASWLVQDGTDIFLVSKLMGHKDIQMTMRYAHLAPNQGKTAITKLEKDFMKD